MARRILLTIHALYSLSLILLLWLDPVKTAPFYPTHPLSSALQNEVQICSTNAEYCEENIAAITTLAAKFANEHSGLLLHDVAQGLFKKQFDYIQRNSTLGSRIMHILTVLAFSQGEIQEAEQLWSLLNTSDLVSMRTHGAQVLMGGQEGEGIALMLNYTTLLRQRFNSAIGTVTLTGNANELRAPATELSEGVLLDLLLNEAHGGVRLASKLGDLSLSVADIRPLNARQRFRLGVGLAKLGLFDMSLRHVSLSATPWEAPLYLLRARLIFSPIHSSVRALALAVDHFERQGEGILLQPSPRSPLMRPVCDSPNEVALALQALPLLHLAGFSAPRMTTLLGHSPVALSVLLSEVFISMCPPSLPPDSLQPSLRSAWLADATSSAAKSSIVPEPPEDTEHDNSQEIEANRNKRSQGHGASRRSSLMKIGIVSGSFDTLSGRIAVGILESIDVKLRSNLELIAMCFPTPRDAITDRANAVFDRHINLSPHNKTLVLERILEVEPHFLLFADGALDSRTFALAHERLARYQGALWGFGAGFGKGVSSIDFYFTPRVLWSHGTVCPQVGGDPVPPQALYGEQVVFLEGLPPLPTVPPTTHSELWTVLQERYLLPPENRTHLYLFPGAVRHLHPEFDETIAVLLRTDPIAIVILAVPRSGRDSLPTMHIAVRHDLTHPTMPAAGVAKLRKRLRANMGDLASRVRVLPPLDERIYHALRLSAIAVLDPYPVGMHIQVFEAMLEGTPVVSAPMLQECTSSHVPGLAAAMGMPFSEWPTTREEYSVLAMRLQREVALREELAPQLDAFPEAPSHGDQLVHFFHALIE